MSELRRPPYALIAAVVILCLALTAYVGGYFVLSKYNDHPNNDVLIREFKHRWQAKIYLPLVKAESLVRGRRIEPSWIEEI